MEALLGEGKIHNRCVLRPQEPSLLHNNKEAKLTTSLMGRVVSIIQLSNSLLEEY